MLSRRNNWKIKDFICTFFFLVPCWSGTWIHFFIRSILWCSAQKTWETSADYWRCSASSLISPLACVFCRLSHVNVSENELECLPLGLLHLGQLKRITAARNKLISLFNIPNGTHTHTHTSGVGDTDIVFFSVHQLYRSLTAVLSSHPPLSMTLSLLHWDCTSH